MVTIAHAIHAAMGDIYPWRHSQTTPIIQSCTALLFPLPQGTLSLKSPIQVALDNPTLFAKQNQKNGMQHDELIIKGNIIASIMDCLIQSVLDRHVDHAQRWINAIKVLLPTINEKDRWQDIRSNWENDPVFRPFHKTGVFKQLLFNWLIDAIEHDTISLTLPPTPNDWAQLTYNIGAVINRLKEANVNIEEINAITSILTQPFTPNHFATNAYGNTPFHIVAGFDLIFKITDQKRHIQHRLSLNITTPQSPDLDLFITNNNPSPLSTHDHYSHPFSAVAILFIAYVSHVAIIISRLVRPSIHTHSSPTPHLPPSPHKKPLSKQASSWVPAIVSDQDAQIPAALHAQHKIIFNCRDRINDTKEALVQLKIELDEWRSTSICHYRPKDTSKRHHVNQVAQTKRISIIISIIRKKMKSLEIRLTELDASLVDWQRLFLQTPLPSRDTLRLNQTVDEIATKQNKERAYLLALHTELTQLEST